MAYHNANIPVIECYVRGNYLRDQKDSFDKYYECRVFGVTSLPGQVPLFHFLMEDGGIWWKAPISAFCKRKGIKELPLNELCMWDSFSYNISVTTFYQLADIKMTYFSRRKVKRSGKYLFTLDWTIGDFNELNFGYADVPGQHKCGHVIQLNDGNYAIQPNNRLKVFETEFVDSPDENIIARLVNTHKYSVETDEKWIVTEKEAGSFDYDFSVNGPSKESK